MSKTTDPKYEQLCEQLYKLMDSFLTEATDQHGNPRSLERLNQDRQLFMEEAMQAFESFHKQELEQAVREARIEGMEAAKARVLRRTEIPKDAKNPTRDYVVILGEEIAGFIDQDIKHLHSTESDKS